MRLLSIALLSVAVGLLAGCNPFSAPTDMMDEYVERVARVLDEDAHLSPIPVADLFPRRRERRLPMPELDLGMLDFLSLYGCELQVVVGERNSGLGRVMQPSNVLRYEVRFINAAEDCLPTLAEKKELQAAVRQARRSKIDSLPIAIWNATWATEEIERLFTRTEGVYPLDATGATVDDLTTDVNLMNARLSALLAGRTGTDLGFLDNVQQRWQAEDRLGQLIKSALLLTTRLNDAADLVERRLADYPLCLNGKTNPDADIARNMFYAVYAERVQPYMAAVDRARVGLVAGFAELAAMQQAVMPEAFGPYYRRYLKQSGDESIWAGLDTAVQRHTESWQRLLKQCGMTPGAS
ncbi:DUF3080 domain-containing protein [Marinobacter sp. JSM 1782161]|uniref:DUF3080 domain-containing protein n=1 Tax=Marinobacter sp. JSM 1782161 TaxID=2685906 RepID=UPI002B1BD0D5|nr:DUF3080 domain-containing protein [Marinobacter sp. JSM 1782161]